MSADNNDSDEKAPVEQWREPPPEDGFSLVKTLAIIFLGVPAALLVIAALVLGICLLAV